MAEKNTDKSYGWHTAQHFSDYIERVVGEFKFISIVTINIKFVCFSITIIPTFLR